MKITAAHGSGGRATSELIDSVFASAFDNDILNKMEDSAIVAGSERLAVTTDSFVVTPLFFKGGDIGRLSICGTVNDLLMSGAIPRYLTCGFIIEEGAEVELLQNIAQSMKKTAEEAHIQIIAGDTKVIEGSGGVYINTAGVGFVPKLRNVSPTNCKAGDAIILSGTLGDHHAAILSARLGIENSINSDCAPLNEMVNALFENEVNVRAMRDVTRGGLATILNEFAKSSKLGIELDESLLPIDEQVSALCGILGLDPLYMGNEGKFVAVIPSEQAERAVEILRAKTYGSRAAIIGYIREGNSVTMKTRLGGSRQIEALFGEGLPRIC